MDRHSIGKYLRALGQRSVAERKIGAKWQSSAKYSYKAFVAAFALVATTWTLSSLVSVYCAVHGHDNALFTPQWDQNYLHPNALTMDSIVGSFFWLALFLLQLVCMAYTCLSQDPMYMDATVDIAAPIGLFNALHAVSLILFTFTHLVWAEVVFVLNFANMSLFYVRNGHIPWRIRCSMASGPLAWTFFAVIWNGACLMPQVEGNTRHAGSVYLWWILCFGMTLAFKYKDDAICFFLSALAMSVGLYHARSDAELHKWLPPVVIAAVLYVTFLVTFVLRWQSNELRKQATVAGAAGYRNEESRVVGDDYQHLLRP